MLEIRYIWRIVLKDSIRTFCVLRIISVISIRISEVMF
jgi:hypothetical protein